MKNNHDSDDVKGKFSFLSFAIDKALAIKIGVALLAIAVLVGVFIAGFFKGPDKNDYTYLPNRSYIIAETDPALPQNLNQLLNTVDADVDTLLKNDAMVETLLMAKSLDEVVDSRLAINNLRSINAQLETKLAQKPDEIAVAYIDDSATKNELQKLEQSLETSSSQPEQVSDDNASGNKETNSANNQTTSTQSTDSEGVLPTDQLAAYKNSDGGKSLLDVIADDEIKQRDQAKALSQRSTDYYAQEYDKAKRLNQAISGLLKPADFSDLVKMPSAISIKTIYDENSGLIHLLPAGDWIPQDGYKLFRVVNGDKQLIETRASYDEILTNVATKFRAGEVATELFNQATLTAAKEKTLGMDRAAFNAMAYRMPDVDKAPRFSSEKDFLNIKDQMLTIPAEISQKVPQTDTLLFNTVLLSNEVDNSKLLAANIRTGVFKNFSVEPANLAYGIDQLKVGDEESANYTLAKEIMTARQQIATLSFVDQEFAEAAGFLVQDDLSSLGLKDGDNIEYVIETSSVNQTISKIIYGDTVKLSKPQSLLGYGVDGKAMLRWQSTLSEREQNIVSGYLIERRLEGESDFVQINDVPVVVSYVLDETNNYFETPVFYEDDELENGREVEYRIRSLDIFGRMSDYSDAIKFKVEKITPPDIPAMGKAVFSGDFEQSAWSSDQAIGNVMEANAGKTGIAIPIFSKSPDTVRFTIYRAVAIGAQGYGPPEVLADVTYQNEMEAPTESEEDAANQPVDTKKIEAVDNNASNLALVQELKNTAGAFQGLVSNPQGAQPNLVFYDTDVSEGTTYKYWVSAWDDWNNESGWSQSSLCAIATDVPPVDTNELNIAMLSRELPDFSKLPPGIYGDSKITVPKFLNMNANSELHAPQGSNTAVVAFADKNNINIGRALNGTTLPKLISTKFDNLPPDNLLHVFVAIPGEDVAGNGYASLKWPPYLGSGLAGYEVYHPIDADASLAEMQGMTRAELLARYDWQRITTEPVKNNQMMVGGLKSGAEDINLFLICLKSKSAASQALSNLAVVNSSNQVQKASLINFYSIADDGAEEALHSGFVKLDWQAPEDPQVEHYRVYRAEVPSFKKPVDESALSWTLIGDHITDTTYTDPVEQTHAHYYYYKINSVSPWAVESQNGKLQRFRVPSTMPPQMPNLLVPLQRKDGVQINFSAVPYCDRYIIYRTAVSKVNEDAISDILPPDLSDDLFKPNTTEGGYLKNILTVNKQNFKLNPMMRLSTIEFDSNSIVDNMKNLPASVKATALSTIYEQYGPLVLSDYRNLPYAELMNIKWTPVGELPADYDTVEGVEPATGLLKPLSIIDNSAEYGIKYYYTVQAWNDDNLGSCRPEPVEASPRRSGPFDPIKGLTRDAAGDVAMRWNQPTMKNLTPERCLEETVGYVVYRADSLDGEYLQVSPLLFDTAWVDEAADRYADNYYRVKVLDTGGYFSEFSEPLLIKDEKLFDLPIYIPTETPDMVAPDVFWVRSLFKATVNKPFEAYYELSGTEPIKLEMTIKDKDGTVINNYKPNPDNQSFIINNDKSMAEGEYSLILKATNNVGEKSTTCKIVFAKAPQIAFDKSKYSQTAGSKLTVPYTLSGTAPIELKLQFLNAGGGLASGCVLDVANKQVILSEQLASGTYTVKLTATNQAGSDSAEFSLTVTKDISQLTEFSTTTKTTEPTTLATKTTTVTTTETTTVTTTVPKPTTLFQTIPTTMFQTQSPIIFQTTTETQTEQTKIPPSVSFYQKSYTFKLSDEVKKIPFRLAGTQPITTSAKLVKKPAPNVIAPPPSQPRNLTITNNEVIIPDDLSVGTYDVIVEASNSAGSASATCQLVLEKMIIPKLNSIPKRQMTVSRAQIQTKPVVVTKPLIEYTAIEGYYNGFALSNLQLQTYAEDSTGYFGKAMLLLGNKKLPVEIFNATIVQLNNQTRITEGVIYIEEYREIEDANLIVASLRISNDQKLPEISGYLKRADDKNVLGNKAVIEFRDASISPDGMITLSQSTIDKLATIRYQDFEISNIQRFLIDINATDAQSTDFIKISSEDINMRMPLETLSGRGLKVNTRQDLQFDFAGELTAKFIVGYQEDVQFLVPGGSLLESRQSEIDCVRGVRQGSFRGKLILPFESDDSVGAGVPNRYAGHSDKYKSGDFILEGALFDEHLLAFGRYVQDNALLIVPEKQEYQDQCAYVDINLAQWDGRAFKTSGAMSTVRITERSLDIKTQRSQAMVLNPISAKVDLDRNDAFAANPQAMTPSETAEPFWVGIIVGGGDLRLPADFVKTESGQPVNFGLAEGEMIYDLNGFNYQNYLYNDKGVSAQFGDALGGFDEVKVYNCLLDMYSNKINLEINADVKVDLFGDEWLKVKLYTNKEDNSDGKKGEFLCSVAPCMIEDGGGQGVDLKIDGGFLRPKGMYCNGSMTIEDESIQTGDPLEFSDLIIPADAGKTNADHPENQDRSYGYVELDKPAMLDFKGFTYETRGLRIMHQSLTGANAIDTPNVLELSGSTLLSNKIPLGQVSSDVITFTGPRNGAPISVDYEDSNSKLEANFDGCVNVVGTLVPKLSAASNESGLVEFDTSKIELNFLEQLESLPVITTTRFGYHPALNRYYFAVGLMEKDGQPINLGYGEVKDFAGLVTNNLVVQKDELNRYIFPANSNEMPAFIKGLQVSEKDGNNFAAGIRGVMKIAGFCEVRELYFGFEEGPIVTAGGDFYTTLSVNSMIAQSPEDHIGSVWITYSHPQRYFAFVATLEEVEVASLKVRGSLGFEFSPNLFGVQIGYPDTLVVNFGYYRIGIGVAFKIDEIDGNYIRAKVEFGLEKSVDISIVYLGGYVYAGADGGYYWGGDDGQRILLELYLKGNVNGGIRAKGKKFNIISLMLDAKGTISGVIEPKEQWDLSSYAKVSYCLDLFMFSIDGSVDAHFSHSF